MIILWKHLRVAIFDLEFSLNCNLFKKHRVLRINSIFTAKPRVNGINSVNIYGLQLLIFN